MTSQRAIIAFAIPVSLQLVCQHAISLITQLFVAGLGDDAVAATGLAAQLSGVALIGLSSLGTAASIKLSRLHGRDEQSALAVLMVRALFLSVLFGMAAALLLVLCASWSLAALGAAPGVIPLAKRFVKLSAVSLPFLAISETASHLLRARGDSRSPMLIGLLSVGLDSVLSAALIPGRWGLPALGLQGAVFAVIASRCSAALLLGWMISRNLRQLRVSGFGTMLDASALWHDLLRPTGPLALGHGAWVLGMTAYAAIYSWLGTSPYAAIQIVQQIESVWVMFSVGLCAACMSLLGQELGRGDESSAKRLVSRLLKMSAVLCALTSISMATLSLLIGRLYPQLTADTAALVVTGLLFCALLQPAKIFNMMLATGVLRTGGDARFVTACEVLMAVGIGCSFVLGLSLKLGLLGVLAGKAIEELTKLFLFLHRFQSGRWIHKV